MRQMNAKMNSNNEGSIDDILNNPNLTAEEKLKVDKKSNYLIYLTIYLSIV